MSTTNTPVAVSEKWKEVIDAGSGFFSASKSCEYCFALTPPADNFYGHRLSNSEVQNYSLPSLEKLYVKASQDLVFVLTGE